MKKIYDFGLAMLLIGYFTVGSIAQITCKDSLTVELSVFNSDATIMVEDVLTSSIPEGTTLDRSSFSCDDLFNPITVKATSGDDECITIVQVVDKVPPVAIVDSEVEFKIPAEFIEVLLNPQLLDDGSFDECGEVLLAVEPEFLSCSDVGNVVDVTLSVIDQSGNINSAVSQVTVVGGDPEPLECLGPVEIAVVEAYTSTFFQFIEGPNDCLQRAVSIADQEGNIVTDKVLTIADVGKTFVATYSQPGATCSTEISIVELECDPFLVCDTECNGSDFGNCGSGHTNEDNVEWPCDVVIDKEYPGYNDTRPSRLMSLYGVAAKDAEPQLTVGDCHSAAVTHIDQVYYVDNTVRTLREWVIIEWRTGYEARFTQEIVFLSGGGSLVWNICDTDANTAPMGDCASGHTDTDDVEWPGDVNAVDHRILPLELLNVSKVAAKDVRPELIANEDYYNVGFRDSLISSTSNFSIVGRKWTIQSTQSASLNANYTQYITVPEVENATDKVFVTTHGGRPMPGVVVNGSETTDLNGVAVVSSEDQITLEYEDDPLQGLDVMDDLLISQHMSGRIYLPIQSRYSMDMNNDGKISVLDIVILKKIIIEGENTSEHNLGWNFIRRDGAFTNVEADYLSFKIGDVDDSALLNDNMLPNLGDNLIFDDVILNAGEQYEIEIRINSPKEVLAGQWEYEIDSSKIEVSMVTTDFFIEHSWYVKDGEDLKMTMYTGNEPLIMDSEDVLMRMRLTAKSNTILSEVLRQSDKAPTFFVSSDYEKIYVGGEVEGQITSGTKDYIDFRTIQVLPNPASHEISIGKAELQDLYAEIFNMNGQKVIQTYKREVDISELPSGIYFIQGFDANEHFKSKFIKL